MTIRKIPIIKLALIYVHQYTAASAYQIPADLQPIRDTFLIVASQGAFGTFRIDGRSSNIGSKYNIAANTSYYGTGWWWLP